MNCYNHQERPAVGMCMNCGRGLCPDCVKRVVGRTSCAGSCAEELREINVGLRGATKNSGAGWYVNGAFMAITATSFLVIGLLVETQVISFLSIPFWIGSAMMFSMGVRSRIAK